MYADATTATSVHARGASKLSADAAAIRIAATTPSIVRSSVVLNDGFVSSCETMRGVLRVSVRTRSRSPVPTEAMGFDPPLPYFRAIIGPRAQMGSLEHAT